MAIIYMTSECCPCENLVSPCCETGCCMYRATTATPANLPDNITLRGVGSLAKIGTSYGNKTNGVILESGVWAVYKNSVRSAQSCLIRGDVEDQFEDAYTVTVNGVGPAIDGVVISKAVTRTSLCLWEFIEVVGETRRDVKLYYDSDSQKWYVSGENTFMGFFVNWAVASVSEGPQNKPNGVTYDIEYAFNIGAGEGQTSTDGVVVTVI